MTLTFNALDVETANQYPESICQIGIAHFYNGSIIDTWSTLINPKTNFHYWNIKIHGIKPEMVLNQPTFIEVQEELVQRLDGSYVVSHTSFDQGVMNKTADFYGLPRLNATWLDSCKIARTVWQSDRKGASFGLKPLADWLGIKFKHHDALEDAITAGRITLLACQHSGLNLHRFK